NYRKSFDGRSNCNQTAGDSFVVRAQRKKSAKHQRKQNKARLAEVITGPDINDHQQIRNYVEPNISRSGHSSCEDGTQSGTIKPGRRIDRDQEKNQPSLSEQACTSEKQRAGRRIHEIVLPRAKKINFMACEDMLAGFVPKFVIKESAAPEVAQKRKSRKHNRRYDKNPCERAQALRAVDSSDETRPIRRRWESRK